jgi:hypothetical protein
MIPSGYHNMISVVHTERPPSNMDPHNTWALAASTHLSIHTRLKYIKCGPERGVVLVGWQAYPVWQTLRHHTSPS